MKNLVNLHLIETDEGLYKFSVLINNVVFTDKICHNNMTEAIEAAVKLTEFINKNALLNIEKIKEWEFA